MNTNARATLTRLRLPLLIVLLLASCCHAPARTRAPRREAHVVEGGGAAAPASCGSASCGGELEIASLPAEEDRRLPRPSSWTRIVTRGYEDEVTVAVFEAGTPPEAARADLVGHLEAAGYSVGPVIAEDTRGFVRGDERVVAVFAPIDGGRSRVSLAVLALK